MVTNTNKHLLIILFFLSTLPAGCVKPLLPPFSALDLSRLDVSPVKGKKIVIDPGHGGTEHGAVGVKGLRESEVNLGVALYLWGFLNDAGARPVLTRYSDKSLVTNEEFSLILSAQLPEFPLKVCSAPNWCPNSCAAVP